MAVDVKFIEKVRRKLLSRGLLGMTKQQLLNLVRTPYHPAKDLNDLLEVWRRRRWIDQYHTGNTAGPHAKHMIRATQLMIDEWPTVQSAMAALMLSPDLDLGHPSEPDQSGSRSDDPEEASPETGASVS